MDNPNPAKSPEKPRCTVCDDLHDIGEQNYGARTLRGSNLLPSAPHCPVCKLLLNGILKFRPQADLMSTEWYLRLTPHSKAKFDPLQIDFGMGSNPYSDFGSVMQLELFTLPGCSSPWTAIGPANFIPHDTASESSLKYIPQWIRKCAEEHSNCYRNAETPLPTRVIDVSAEPYLYVTNSESAPYICLSYCWGKFEPFKTTRENLDERMKSIPFGNLPKTYRDAIEITRRLGVKYLWIDALCIIQGDLQDWETESANMSRIYGSAYLTLAASTSSHADGGLFRSWDPTADGPFSLFAELPDRPSTPFHIRRYIPHNGDELATGGKYAREALRTRAWAFQEYLLTPRLVRFGALELQWECAAAAWCPCSKTAGRWADGWNLSKPAFSEMLASKPVPSPGSDPSRLGFWAAWREIVGMYSHMVLTNGRDKLPALSGIARLFQEKMGSRYLAGLWEADLAYQLAWRLPTYGTVKQRRPREYRAPSWSWAAVDSPVTMMAQEGPFLKHLKVLGCEVETSEVDPTGTVAGGVLRVCGAVVEGVYRYDKKGDSHIVEREGVTLPFFADAVFEGEDGWGELRAGDAVYCLEMGFSDMTFIGYDTATDLAAMVLRNSRVVEGAFERVGFVSTPDKKVWKWFEGLVDAELSVV